MSGYHTDLGSAEERDAGYFDLPWRWDDIIANQRFIVQFASTDDHLVPVEEARHVHEQLHTEYHEHDSDGHFNYQETFPALLESLVRNVTEALS